MEKNKKVPKEEKKFSPIELKKELSRIEKQKKMRKVEKKLLEQYISERKFDISLPEFMKQHKEWNEIFNEVNAEHHLKNNKTELASAEKMEKEVKKLMRNQ